MVKPPLIPINPDRPVSMIQHRRLSSNSQESTNVGTPSPVNSCDDSPRQGKFYNPKKRFVGDYNKLIAAQQMSDGGGKVRGGKVLKSFTKTCSVCGDLAPEHIHYGSITCFSCRAFFRRSVPKSHLYACPGNRTCEIGVSTRKNCQYCRYQACITAGMRPTWVLTENEKRARMEKKRKNAAAKRAEADGTQSTPPYLLQQQRNQAENKLPPISVIETRQLEELLFAQESAKHSESFSRPVLDALAKCTRDPIQVMPRWASFDFFAVQYSRSAKFAMMVQDFLKLSHDSQRLLLQQNMEALTNVRLATIFKTMAHFNPNDLDSQREELGVETEKLGRYPISMEQIFTPEWAANKHHQNLYVKVMSSTGSILGSDSKITILFQLINLFDTTGADFLKLSVEDRQEISKTQEKYCQLLYRYLNMKLGRQSRTFQADLMYLLHDFRMLSEMTNKK